MKRVLMLGAGPLQVPALKCLKDLGCYVVGADYDPVAPGFSLVDRSEVVSTTDMEGVLALARAVRPDYVITSTTDAPVRTAAYVSERLGLFTGISYEDSICATQKDAMRDRLSARGVPIPSYCACRSEAAFERAIAHFEGDCVVKPADSAASRGVLILDRVPLRDEIHEMFERALSFSRKGTVMVEERMRGPEVSVEAITMRGETTVLAVTDKLVTPPPYCVELGHCEQSRLSTEAKASIEQVALSAIDAIGIVDGPSHTEIMVTRQGPKVVEIAARLGGDYITSRLVPLSTGVDLVGASVRVALEMGADVSPLFDRGSAIRFITARSGSISSLEVDAGIRQMRGFEEVVLYKGVGDSISSPHSSNDRVGHVIFTGPDAGRAASMADKALSMVRCEVI